jgi:hypothetical protein
MSNIFIDLITNAIKIWKAWITYVIFAVSLITLNCCFTIIQALWKGFPFVNQALIILICAWVTEPIAQCFHLVGAHDVRVLYLGRLHLDHVPHSFIRQSAVDAEFKFIEQLSGASAQPSACKISCTKIMKVFVYTTVSWIYISSVFPYLPLYSSTSVLLNYINAYVDWNLAYNKNNRLWSGYYHIFLRSSGSGTGFTQPREDNWGATWKDSSGSGLEKRN